jgi:sulfatase modifying factor 1
VTQAEWDAVYTWAVTNNYAFDNAGLGCATNHPVRNVNWYDAVKWCNARSEQEGRTPVYTVSGDIYRSGQSNEVAVNVSANGYRLPTDAEWEFAARGGTQSQGYEYSGSAEVNAVAWYWDNSSGAACNYYEGRGTWPVGQKGANELGLYDMSGNVWEWVFDWHPEFVGSLRVIRGGAWSFDTWDGRVAYRYLGHPNHSNSTGGFRAVLPPGQQ